MTAAGRDTVREIDETAPLLDKKPKRTPLPWFQFSLVLFLQLAEPLTSQVITPFAPQLVRDIGITHGDETKVGYYVGLMHSLFFLTQAFTVLNWSRLSDRIGRKPVLLIGLCGISISMYSFGLSTTFWGFVLSRCLNGALNGNIGIMKSIMAELTDATNISQAYGYQPIPWSVGSVLGPLIGGALVNPVQRFPSVFGDSAFLKKYPYFLPSAVPATFALVAWAVTYTYLKETHPYPQPISSLFKSKKEDANATSKMDDIPEEERPYPLRKLMIRKVLLAGGNYAALSLVEITYRAIHPLFYATPVSMGGLGLEPPAIGQILSIYGLLNGIAQVFFFAHIHDYLGSKKMFTLGIACGFPMFASFPLCSILMRYYGMGWAVKCIIAIQVALPVCLSFSYGAIFIYIAQASPNRASLGATNGICQMGVSLMRAVGPALASSLYSLSLQRHVLGGWMVYYAMFGVVALGIVSASLLPQTEKVAKK